MKIVIVGTSYPYRGGIAAFTDRLATEFVKEGIDIEVVTFKLQYPSFLFPGKTQYSDAKAPAGFYIERKINSISPLNWIKVGKEIRKKNSDIVIFTYWMSFFAPCFGKIARVIKRRCNARCIGLIHNMIPHEKSVLDKMFAPYFVKAMDGFVALSQSVLDDVASLDKQGKPKCMVPHPLYDHYGEIMKRNEALKHLDLDPNYRYCLFFGLVRAYKGLDLLIDAFADERLRKNDVKLIVAGEFYDDEKPYLEQIKKHNLEDFIIIENQYISDDNVKYYFNVADIVVQPYKSATQSGVTQIAYHFEKPMLVTNVGGLGEIIPDGKVGYVVEPKPSSIADALVDFFENGRFDAFVEGVRDEKQTYQWSNMTAAIKKLL
ncbi:MAG: glycosyl transferase family 1 [Bacteroidetes bacterium]|nr:glycosyl transferase family 1 [Bacteroidota bacterium]